MVDNAPADGATRALVAHPVSRRCATWPSRSPASTSPATARWSRPRHGRWWRFSTTTRWPRRGLGRRAARASSRPSPRGGVHRAGRAAALETPGERLFEANGGFSRGPERIVLPGSTPTVPLHGRPAPLIAWAISVGSGCSYAVRRDAALALGGFDEALDLGLPLPGGGDHDSALAGSAGAGHAVVYEPPALAWHEHRREVGGGARPDRRPPARGAGVPGQAPGGRTRRARPTLLGYTGWRLAKPGVRLLRRALGGIRCRPAVLLRMWWNCWMGLTAYPRARRLGAASGGSGTPHDRRRSAACAACGATASCCTASWCATSR